MSSLFDSTVYSERKRIPAARISMLDFAREVILNGEDGDFQFRMRYRHDVASRFWYEVEWTAEDGERHTAEAQELDLCLWRAAILNKQISERLEREKEIAASKENPIKLLLKCPKCDKPHLDEGEWRTRPHRTHLCEHCGEKWQPDHRYSIGVTTQEFVTGRTDPRR